MFACVFLCAFVNHLAAQGPPNTQNNDTSRYPLRDRYGDPLTYPNRNPFDLKDTGYIKRNIEYDPATKQYYVIEKIGDKYYRTPTTLTYEEFLRLSRKC